MFVNEVKWKNFRLVFFFKMQWLVSSTLSFSFNCFCSWTCQLNLTELLLSVWFPKCVVTWVTSFLNRAVCLFCLNLTFHDLKYIIPLSHVLKFGLFSIIFIFCWWCGAEELFRFLFTSQNQQEWILPTLPLYQMLKLFYHPCRGWDTVLVSEIGLYFFSSPMSKMTLSSYIFINGSPS